MMKKRHFYFVLLLIVTLLFSTACGTAEAYDPNRHQYTPEERSAHHAEDQNTSLHSSITIPDDKLLEYTVLYSDLILKGRVADDGVSEVVPMFEGVNESPPVTITSYQIDVREVLYGSYDEEQLTLRFYSDQTKPYQGDELLLFLKVRSNYCIPTRAKDDSVFVINPPENQLVALSVREPLTVFDNQDIADLESEIADIVEGFQSATEYSYGVGAVGLLALTEDSPLYEEMKSMYDNNPIYFPEYDKIFD